MDPIKAEKLRAMNSYNKSHQFLYNLILHSFTALTCCLLCTYPYWFPFLCSSVKLFLFTSLPSISSYLFNPKSLFVVVNVIVVFLVGESKLVGSAESSSSPPVNEIYDEYVERSQSLRRGQYSNLQDRKEEMRKVEMSSENQSLREDISNLQEKKEEKEEVIKVEDDSENIIIDEEEEEEEGGMPVEELNKRADEFIAKVNKQMWVEAN